jgi:SAM-dependent methyltransferase
MPIVAPADSTLARWFVTPAGNYVLQWELDQFDNAVEDIFGFRAVQIGLPDIDFLRRNRISYRFPLSLEPGSAVTADPLHLPIASQSIDLLVLPHVLEFSADPHRVLREAERVLMPDGQIVISGFNTLSFWGLKQSLARRGSKSPWNAHMIGLLRLKDWLKLLGFELNGGKFGCYAPPFASEKWLSRFAFMEKAGARWWPIAGGVYVVRAIKRTIGMRLVTPAWKKERTPSAALSPVTRSNGHASRQSDD